MTILLVVLFVILCALLILVVLLQSGKAGDLASAFGATSSQTAFGSRGTATFLSKTTTVLAVVFLLSSLCLTAYQLSGNRTMLRDVEGAAPAPPSGPTGAGQVVPETVPEATGAPAAAESPIAPPPSGVGSEGATAPLAPEAAAPSPAQESGPPAPQGP